MQNPVEIKRFSEADLESQRHRHDVVGSRCDGRYKCIKQKGWQGKHG
jgi:hypothetical protein